MNKELAAMMGAIREFGQLLLTSGLGMKGGAVFGDELMKRQR